MTPDARQPMLGPAYMMLGMVMGASIDVSVKALTAGYALGEIVVLRSLLALPLVLLICHRESGIASLATPRWGWQLCRGLLAAGASFGFFHGLAHIELVTTMLLAYLAPVIIVLLARPLLGEAVGLFQWIGIVIAFVGVLSVLQPGSFDFHPAAFSVIGSSVCWALLSLTNRHLAQVESAGVLAFYTVPVSAAVGAVLVLVGPPGWGGWTPPTGFDWMLLAVAGTAGGFVHVFVALAYRHAPPAVVAPFEYTTLIWGTLAGYVFWGEIPTGWVAAGGAAVIAGGYIAMRGRG